MLPPRPAPIPLPLAIPLSWAYLVGMRLHTALRARARTRLPVPVISVGNLSLGGTGKTPMVLHLARVLAAAGRRPCIAMRGYASHSRAGSDEADAYRRTLSALRLDVPVVARPHRAAGVLELLVQRPSIDCVLLDDGFQHHRLARDLDIVLIDATRPPTTDRLLPAGWLREPMSALARAHAVVITHAQSVTPDALNSLAAAVEAVHNRPPIALTSHAWTGLDVLFPPTPGLPPVQREADVAWLRGKRVLGVCAIGNSDSFLKAAGDALGAAPASTITLRDHDPYAPPTLDRILAAARGFDAIITTDKDWSKLRHVDPARWPCPVVRPRLELRFDSGRQALDDLVLRGAARTA